MRTREGNRWRGVAVVGSLGLLAACSSASPHVAATVPRTAAPTSTTTSTLATTSTRRARHRPAATTTTSATTVPATTGATSPPVQPPAAPLTAPPTAPATPPPATSPPGPSGVSSTIGTFDGAAVTVARMDGSRVHLSLQPPWQFPNSIRPKIVIAFNGGFQYPAGDNGYRVGGTVQGVFNNGMAAIVGYANGSVKLGMWGRDVPGGAPIAWARSNLSMLVDGGAPSPQIGALGAWGAPLQSLGQGYDVARSSLGVDAAGNFLYAACWMCLPVSLAHALISQGAVRAMQLDINPWWVMCMRYSGGVPSKLFDNPNHDASVFDAGWGRDFFVGQVS